jgi:hypothetical protein
MIGRCYNQNHERFVYYGARGITVCERWRNSVEAFVSDVGPRPSPLHSLDRINNNGNYEPSNCRWATKKTQSLNRRMAVMLTFNGKTQPMTAWAEELGVRSRMLQARHARGWSDQKILATPKLKTWNRRPTPCS